MKPRHYFIVMLLAVVCVALTVALIIMTHTNQQLQVQLQSQQQALGQGILGQQAQQISAGVLQDLADAAVKSSEIRQLLEKHGYRLPSPRFQGSAIDASEQKREEAANIEAPTP